MTKIDILQIEHDAITEVEREDECYTPPYGDERTNYIERHYVSNYTPKIFENLRFYKTKKGKYISIYVKKGKGTKSPVTDYMKEVEKALENSIAPLRKIDVDVLNHLKAHIRAKIMKNQRDTLRRLRKEKEK